ncbi:hypothetical protein [Modestobacter sp. VKM Ac-2985]|uniref:hypothetical protein n=1 Tax=Modestobacter sp. VKM Ac-2985 TaxID=3004139 RepID=UPI0022AB59D4|nr:hypothetical protein [Modestobacter sp. VKM Ac-2985]MCZ2837168.1 hypothetical protein [Modestobacter sp. VKM Ac-2985]
MTARKRQTEATRGTGPVIVDPAVIRQVLAHADRTSYVAAAARYQVSVRTVTRWQRRRRDAAAAGSVWPSDADVAHWRDRQPARSVASRRTQRWQVRRLAEGPLLVDPAGTARRLQALAALGYRYEDVAGVLGLSKSRARDLTLMRGAGRVHRDTAGAVAAAYEQLSMTHGPSPRCRALAASRGWPPPLAWDDESIDDPAARPVLGDADAVLFDEVAVARAVRGEQVHLRPVERREAVHQLAAAGLTRGAIAARLQISTRAVERHRATPRPTTDTAAA